jgi:hypothetical protein
VYTFQAGRREVAVCIQAAIGLTTGGRRAGNVYKAVYACKPRHYTQEHGYANLPFALLVLDALLGAVLMAVDNLVVQDHGTIRVGAALQVEPSTIRTFEDLSVIYFMLILNTYPREEKTYSEGKSGWWRPAASY